VQTTCVCANSIDARIRAMITRFAMAFASFLKRFGRDALRKTGNATAVRMTTTAATVTICTRENPRIFRVRARANSGRASLVVMR